MLRIGIKWPAVAGCLMAVLFACGIHRAQATPVDAPVYAIDDYPYQKAPALKQWRSVLERSAADEAKWTGEQCADDAPEYDCAAKQAHLLEEKLKDKTPVEQIYGVYTYFNAFKYQEHGANCTEDCWATRLQFIARHQGDCGDHALAEYFTLKRLGFKERDLQLIVAQLPGYEDSFKGGHVVLRVAAAGHYYILDNRRTDVTGLKGLDKYKVLAGLNADSVQIYNVVTPQPPAGYVADETKIADLVASPSELPKPLAPMPGLEPKIVLASVVSPSDAPTTGAEDEAALMDCTQTATLGDWNPNLPCSAFELPDTAPKAQAKKEKPTVVATLAVSDVAKPTSRPKATQVAAAKAPEKPAKKKKKKKASASGSCVQGAASIADWNPNLPCASDESASRLTLLDVPPAL